MEMATPRINVFNSNIHICVILEKVATSGFSFNEFTFPLLFTHNTKPLQITRLTSTGRPNILNIKKYSNLGQYTIWEIPINSECTVDLNLLCCCENNCMCGEYYKPKIAIAQSHQLNVQNLNSKLEIPCKFITIDSIVKKIFDCNVIYIVNLPNNYYDIFQKINHEYHKKYTVANDK